MRLRVNNGMEISGGDQAGFQGGILNEARRNSLLISRSIEQQWQRDERTVTFLVKPGKESWATGTSH